MATGSAAPLTLDDLARMPDDGLRRELLDGRLVVTPAPVPRHQRVLLRLAVALASGVDAAGGELLLAPVDVVLSPHDVVQPDLLYVTARNLHRVGPRHVQGPPDLVAEISSPGTRSRDLGVKRRTYERFGVPEYWFVDLEHERVQVFRRRDGDDAPPATVAPPAALTTPLLPELELDVAALLCDG
jgi:Uma2 family endonuclease